MSPDPLPTPVHLLLVDDDRVDRIAAVRALERADIEVEVVEAASVAEAVEALASGKLDCALVDFNLPDGDGSDVLEAALARPEPLPVIMLTGRGGESLAVELMKEGARDYIPKGSVTPARLSQSLRQVLATRQAEREAAAARGAQEILVEAGTRLAQSLDFETTLSTVAEVCVPPLADYVLVDVLEDGELVRGAVRAAETELQEALEDAAPRPPRPSDPSPIRQVLESGEGLRLGDPGEEWGERIGLVDVGEEARSRLRPVSLMVLPLVARGRTGGVLTLAATRPDHPFSDHDFRVGQALASRAALALDNARLHRESQEAIRARDETLGVVSHDLRNPLNVISAAAGLLLDIPLSEEKKEQQLRTIRRAAERMNLLIQDLLDVSGIEAGRFRVEPERADPARMLSDACEMMEPLARKREIRLECRRPEESPMVLADPERMLRVFSNLIGNALKFTPPGGLVELGGEVVDRGIRFWVRDTGPGIPAEDVPHLFERFWKGGSGSNDGAGLGLPIAQGIVEVHGGRIEVESEEGEGSVFHFVLPFAEAAHEAESGMEKARS